MNKTYIIIAAVVLIAAGLWFLLNQPALNVPVDNAAVSADAATSTDTTTSINQDLNNINVESPDFKSIDTDLDSL